MFKFKMMLLLQALILVPGAVMRRFDALPDLFKVLSSALLLVLAFLVVIKRKETGKSLLIPSVLCCFIGDLILMGLLPGGLPVGMLSFGIAQCLFILMHIRLTRSAGGKIIGKELLLSSALYWAVLLAVWLSFMKNTSSAVIVWGSLVYGLLISTMAALTIPLYKADKRRFPTVVGSLLFAFSDSLLAATQVTSFYGSELLIWITYVFGLYLIIAPAGKQKNGTIRQRKSNTL